VSSAVTPYVGSSGGSRAESVNSGPTIISASAKSVPLLTGFKLEAFKKFLDQYQDYLMASAGSQHPSYGFSKFGPMVASAWQRMAYMLPDMLYYQDWERLQDVREAADQLRGFVRLYYKKQISVLRRTLLAERTTGPEGLHKFVEDLASMRMSGLNDDPAMKATMLNGLRKNYTSIYDILVEHAHHCTYDELLEFLMDEVSDLASATARFASKKADRKDAQSDEEAGGGDDRPPGKKLKRKRGKRGGARQYPHFQGKGNDPAKGKQQDQSAKGKKDEHSKQDKQPAKEKDKPRKDDYKSKDKKKDKKKEE
jgi:hypothetical protein